jgi:hypothetical protein
LTNLESFPQSLHFATKDQMSFPNTHSTSTAIRLRNPSGVFATLTLTNDTIF